MNLKTKFKIRSQIVTDLKSGAKKKDIYNSLIQKHGDDPVFERILNDVPSATTVNKYNILNKSLLTILVVIAAIKCYFLILGFIKHSGPPNFQIFSTIVTQLIVILMVFKISRLGLIATAVYLGLQFFDYQNGIYHDNVTVKYLCIVLLILFVLAGMLSIFLYIKSKENWWE